MSKIYKLSATETTPVRSLNSHTNLHSTSNKKFHTRQQSSSSDSSINSRINSRTNSSTDIQGKLKPQKTKLNRLIAKWKRNKTLKFLIPLLYIVAFLIILYSFQSSTNSISQLLSSRNNQIDQDNTDYYSYSTSSSTSSSSSSSSSSIINNFLNLFNFNKKLEKPDAKNELLNENKDKNSILEFPFDAQTCVLPNAPFKHVLETTDIRSTYTIYYDAIRMYLDELKINPKAGLPEFDFHWKDWIDMKDLQPLIEQKPNCFAAGVLGSNIRTPWPDCIDSNKIENEFDLNFYFNKPAKDYENEYRLNLRGKTYLYKIAPNPSRLIFLAGDLAFVVKVGDRKDIVKSGMLEKYIKGRMEKLDVTYQQLITAPISTLDTLEEISISLGRPLVDLDNVKLSEIKLSSDQFELLPNKKKSKKAQLAFLSNDKHFYDTLIRLDERTVIQGKYDWRFFNKLINDELENRGSWHQLIRAWLQFSSNLGITSWLADEALLGWSRNGLLSPWEKSVHFEVPAKDMIRLAESFNQSLVIQDPRDGTGSFLIDISPHYMERARENNGNASPESIDLKFIDTRTGLYIEVNGLMLSKDSLDIPSNAIEMLENESKVWKDVKIVDNRYKVDSNLKKFINSGTGRMYHIDQLSPLRRTLFEGRLANVPYRFKAVLDMLYKDILNLHEFFGHKYIPHLRLWVDSSKCKYVPDEDIEHFKNGGSNFIGACHDHKIWKEYDMTRAATLFKFWEADKDYSLKLSSSDELPLLYDDYWLTQREKTLNEVYGIPLPQIEEENEQQR
ncbi:hypothetical protein CANARDRAFT_25211 [[Candida] arabinofermentans NRRL YB-2248]|uniref:LicD/FKTN/FKRP nucleotidyltransferase domain-containing protein n=1 Tax=[Candida] arabinofermentans NRRL YB-2248 TaxID=983967 RepID=A0A1E4SUQ2_9ASCO|nr:hypothetical protein CANARDRAFT_25211 [[Candida] arabinofermentans NRRL YB-2248]